MKNILNLLIFLFPYVLFSQSIDFNNYRGLQCKGNLPKVFTTSLLEKYNEHKSEITEKSDNYSEKREKKRFALIASHSLNELLLNGQVLFGDELTNYIQEVGKKILEANNIENKEQIEFFIIKSQSVNAFTTNEGKIFMSVGLIAQLETEAQLAFILAHEIAHFQNKHVLDGFLFKRNIEKKSSNRYSSGDDLIKKSNHSKEAELEADAKGLDLFLKTKYGTGSLLGVFDILKFAHLPIDEISFNPSYFENENFKIPTSYLPDSLNKIRVLDNAELSTHPSSDKRAEIIEELLISKSKKGEHFLLGEKLFKLNRNIARFELSKILLEKKEYQALLYNNYVLSKEYPNNFFIDYTNSRALYFLSRYKLIDKTDNLIINNSEIQGESRKLYALVENMPSKEFAIMSISYIWKIQKKYPNDKRFKELASTILNEVVIIKDLKAETFVKTQKKEDLKNNTKSEINSEKTNIDSDNQYQRSSKYKNITKKLESEGEIRVSGSVDNKYIYYAFGGHFTDPEFTEIFNLAFKNKSSVEIVENENKTKKRIKANQAIDNDGWNSRKEGRLGLKRILFIDPIHLILDTRKKDVLRLIETTNKQTELSALIIKLGTELGIKTEMLDSRNLSESESDKFNDIIVFNRMINELNSHGDLDSVSLSENQYLQEIALKYEIDHVCWNVMLSFTEKDNTKLRMLGYALLFYPIIPFVIYDALTPDITTLNFFYVYDIPKGKVIYYKKSKIEGKYNKSVIAQNIYHNMQQLKKAPKK